MDQFYKEKRDAGNRYRAEQLRQIESLIVKKRKLADRQRAEYFRCDFSSVDNYVSSVEQYRADLIHMLGWPLNGYDERMPVPDAGIEYVSEDSLGRIFRLNIEVMEDVTAYGILFLPHTAPPYPLILSQHGGWGTPELCSDFFGSDNYHDMTRRVLRKGAAVFAPQLLLWKEEFGPEFDRVHIDVRTQAAWGFDYGSGAF